jgi:hypothetical protein
VEKWTSSLGDSRASLSAKLESVKQLMTHDTSSLSSQMESGNANPQLSFSKMWKGYSVAEQETENQFSNMSSEHWKTWVTGQRQEYSQRVKSAQLIRESGSSSLGWPTASVAGCVEGGVAKNVEMTPSGFKATRENGTSYGAKLRDAVIHHEMNWPTPKTRDYRDGMNLQKVIRKDGKHRLDSTPRLVQTVTYGYPDPTNPNTNGKNRGSLNPNWVEQLMGVPVGWTDLGFWATQSSQPQPPKPSLPLSND